MNEQDFLVRVAADLADLIPRYLDNRQKDLHDSRQALSLGDYHRLERIGHNIRGSGGGYGFQRLAEIGASLERAASDHEAEQVEASLEDLDEYLRRVEVVYA